MTAPPRDQPLLAETVTAQQLAQGFRSLQLDLRRQLIRDTTRGWAGLNFTRLSATWPTWLRLMTVLIGRYQARSAQQAGDYYLATRQLATGTVADQSILQLGQPVNVQQVARALGYAAPGVYSQHLAAGDAPELAERHALTQTLGTTSRLTLDGGRQTVLNTAQADRQAVGYYRVTDGDPCAFCALMASRVVAKHGRGRFYTSAFAAGDGNKYHNNCGCTVAVAFTRDLKLSETSVLADAMYRDGNGSLADFRKAWNEHLANKRPAA